MRSSTVYLKDVKPGDILVADGGFTCIHEGRECEVQQADRTDCNPLFVWCCGERPDFRSGNNEGSSGYTDHHFLDGQEDEHGRLIGFSRKEAA